MLFPIHCAYSWQDVVKPEVACDSKRLCELGKEAKDQLYIKQSKFIKKIYIILTFKVMIQYAKKGLSNSLG